MEEISFPSIHLLKLKERSVRICLFRFLGESLPLLDSCHHFIKRHFQHGMTEFFQRHRIRFLLVQPTALVHCRRPNPTRKRSRTFSVADSANPSNLLLLLSVNLFPSKVVAVIGAASMYPAAGASSSSAFVPETVEVRSREERFPYREA